MRYTPIPVGFMPWQPTTWPEPPTSYIPEFSETLGKILQETILDEINNVISDAIQVNGGLTHRGHVVVLALLCAVDSIAAYAFRGGVGLRYKNFISTYFPPEYKPFADNIYKLYRNSSVHSWNLFQVGIWPGNEAITTNNGSMSFGLINFQSALTQAVNAFLTDLPNNTTLQANSLARYTELKSTAI
jgi:hypothetical protein